MFCRLDGCDYDVMCYRSLFQGKFAENLPTRFKTRDSSKKSKNSLIVRGDATTFLWCCILHASYIRYTGVRIRYDGSFLFFSSCVVRHCRSLAENANGIHLPFVLVNVFSFLLCNRERCLTQLLATKL